MSRSSKSSNRTAKQEQAAEEKSTRLITDEELRVLDEMHFAYQFPDSSFSHFVTYGEYQGLSARLAAAELQLQKVTTELTARKRKQVYMLHVLIAADYQCRDHPEDTEQGLLDAVAMYRRFVNQK